MTGADRRDDRGGARRSTGDAALGALIQAFIRLRWGEQVDPAAEKLPPEMPDADLRDRLETLGLDALKLLRVSPAAVPGELRLLEQQSVQEDARALAAAGRHWARETRGSGGRFDGVGDNSARNDAPQPSGRQRTSGGRRSGPARSTR